MNLDVHTQVDRLIEQAHSLENLCILYVGWCPVSPSEWPSLCSSSGRFSVVEEDYFLENPNGLQLLSWLV
jgi:hypothetical protein